MKKLFSNMNEDKREKIVFRLYVLNLLLNVIFYFVVNSLNNIDEILVFNLLNQSLCNFPELKFSYVSVSGNLFIAFSFLMFGYCNLI